MNQHFEPAQTDVSGLLPAPVSQEASPSVCASEPTEFSALSSAGQSVVSDYFAHMERDLIRRAADGGTALSTYERTETLREMQAHLLSLIAAYQEIGDDEQTAIAAALAQFGKAGTVSVDLRRAQARNKVARLLRKNDHLLPAVLLPAFFYNISLLLTFLATTTRVVGDIGGPTTTTTAVPLGWHALLLLPFVCGAINANLSKKWSLLGIFMGVAAVIGTITLLDTLFGGGSPARLFPMQASLVPWLGSACFGILFAHIAKAMRPKKQAA